MNDLQLYALRRGALVFDSMGRPLGTLDYVQTPDVRRADSVVQDDEGAGNHQSIWDFGEDILELVFQGDDQFTDDLVARMEEQGYLHVTRPDTSGIFIFGDQLDHEEGGAIFLNVEEESLLSYQASTTR